MEITGESLGGVMNFLLGKWGLYIGIFFLLYNLVQTIFAYRKGDKVMFYICILITACWAGAMLHLHVIRKHFGPGPTIFGIPLY
jgi:hypothetical protein